MRRLLGAVLAAVCLTMMSSPAVAAGAAYTLSELSLQVTLPDGYYAFTRDIDPTDPHLERFGDERAADTLRAYYEDAGIYLAVYAEDDSCEILVSMAEDSGTRRNFDFNRYTDEVVLGFGQEIQNGAYEGIAYTACEVFAHAQAKFLRLDFALHDGDQTQYGRQYYTILNGQEISFSLYASSGPVTEDMDAALRQIVEDVHFTRVLSEPEPSALPWILAGAAVVVVAAVGIAIWLWRRRAR